MRRALTALVLALAFPAGASAYRNHHGIYGGHRCHACDVAWGRHHHPHPRLDSGGIASVFNDNEPIACRRYHTYGFASRTLPCGMRVTFHYHGRTVTGVVEDRGPWIKGRIYDLNESLAAALGCDGLCKVRASA